MKPIRVAATVLAALVCCASSFAQPVLEKVVIVERHGVRPPTKAAVDLAKFSEAPWPEWTVKPGELTPHGTQALEIMGGALHRLYIKDGLLAAGDCPAGLFVWSDSGDQRTRASGDALQRGMGCKKPSDHLEAGTTDPVFSGNAKICRPDPANAKNAIETWLNLDLAGNRAAYEKGRNVLQSVLTPNGCGRPGQRECVVGEGEHTVSVNNGEARLEGPLSTASSLSENLLLEFSEGMPLQDVGWGKGAAALNDVLVLHNLYADVTRRNLVFAARRGSPLAQQIVDLLNSRPSTFQGAAPVPGDAKLIVFLGHDTNLSNMSGLIGTPWSLPGQPDATAPDTGLAFELWRAADGTRSVKVKVLYQTPEDTRALTKLEVPREQPLALTRCPGGICSVLELTKRMEKNIAPDCLKP